MAATEETRTTRILRISGDLYRANRRLAESEHRAMNTQLELVYDAGLRALGLGTLDEQVELAREDEPVAAAS